MIGGAVEKRKRLDNTNRRFLGLLICAGCLALVVLMIRYGRHGQSELGEPAALSPVNFLIPSATSGMLVETCLLADLDQVVLWSYHIGGEFMGSPVARLDGSVVVAGNGATVYSVAPGGDLLWSSTVSISSGDDSHDISPVAVDRDGAVYLTAGRRLVALRADGKPQWDYEVESGWLTAPTISQRGVVLTKNRADLGADSEFVQALSLSGELKWSYQAQYPLSDSPLRVGKDGRFYDLGSSGSLVSFSKRGNRGWGLGMHDGARGPAIDSNGVLHLVSQPDPDKNNIWLAVALIPQSGGAEEKWHFELPGEPVCDPVVGAAVRAFFACRAGSETCKQPDVVYAFNSNGEIDWELALFDVEELIPAGTPGGVMCVRTKTGTFIVSAAGEILFSLSQANGQPIPRVIGTDGVIYCEQAGTLVAIDAGAAKVP